MHMPVAEQPWAYAHHLTSAALSPAPYAWLPSVSSAEAKPNRKNLGGGSSGGGSEEASSRQHRHGYCLREQSYPLAMPCQVCADFPEGGVPAGRPAVGVYTAPAGPEGYTPTALFPHGAPKPKIKVRAPTGAHIYHI